MAFVSLMNTLKSTGTAKSIVALQFVPLLHLSADIMQMFSLNYNSTFWFT